VRYIDSLNLKSGLKCFILIEPGLGYIIPVLQERFKDSKIIALHAASAPLLPHVGEGETSAVQTLYSADPAEINKFLEANIPEIDVSLINIIEWRPSLNFYKEEYVKLLSHVVDFIKRADAENRTTAAFGKRWVKNFLKNLGNVNTTLLYKQTAIPVIVTGSGPSLEQALPVIKEAQDSCLIIAASSSVMALSAAGITADIVIATDGGPWALRHLYSCYRGTNTNALAVNLSAALPSQVSRTPALLLNDGSFWQSIILHELALPSVLIPQKGTVTATAVELAMILSEGYIYLAGMDFSVNDIRTHVRPYGFDSMFLGRAGRFAPFYSESFTRSTLIRQGASMDIYAAWFKSQLGSWPKRIFSIGKSKVFEEAVPAKQAKNKNTDDFFKTEPVKENPDTFKKRGTRILIDAIKNPKYAQDLKQELSLFLFPGENNITEKMFETAIEKIAFFKDSYE